MTTSRRTLLSFAAAAVPAAFLGGSLSACSRGGDKALTIIADATPHTEIIQQAQKLGLLDGVKINLKGITGDIDPNQLVESGDVDVNYFQHQPYLDSWSKQKGTDDLVSVASVHVEPLGLYSRKVKATSDIPTGATIAIPNDPSNQARALLLLVDAGLLKLDVQRGQKDLDYSQVTEKNITDNPKQLKFLLIDRPQLAATLDDAKVNASVINGNYALEAGLKPAKDALQLEPAKDNPYANIVVTRKALADDSRVKKLAEALTSSQIAEWITKTYDGSVLPVAR